MKKRFYLFRRKGIYYCQCSLTGQQASLKTTRKDEAQELLLSKNEADRQRQLNLAKAKVYLSSNDDKLVHRTWTEVMHLMATRGKPVTQKRVRRAMQNASFNHIRHQVIVETTSEHFIAVLADQKHSTNHYLRQLQNLATGMGWLPWEILPSKLWPRPNPKPKRAITWEEHQRILAQATTTEWSLYLQLLWEIGASQSDAAKLTSENVDWNNRTLSYRRMKLEGRDHGAARLVIGKSLASVLKQLPQEGPLFPKLHTLAEKCRTTRFWKVCQELNIKGISLHSYRYAWAERAKVCGYPERWAQQALGHNSKAVHRAYAKKADFVLPSLEDYEEKIVSVNSFKT